MRRLSASLGLALAAMTAVLAACQADRALPSAPALRPSKEVVNPAVAATAVTRLVPLDRDITVGGWFNHQGGVLEIPETGLFVYIPKGAVKGQTYITATALAGPVLAYDFGPHGTVFNKPLAMAQDLGATNWVMMDHTAKLEIGYFANDSQIDEDAKKVLINEFLPAWIFPNTNWLVFSVKHFSGYMVSSGRQSVSQ